MNRFYIVRHGETENNRAGRLSGWIDTPLTETGLQFIRTVEAKLANIPIDAIYSSDVGRAFITAYVFARDVDFTKEIIRLPGLREVNYGDAANMLKTEAYRLCPKLDRDTHFTPPGGESLRHMQERVLATIIKLDQAHTDANIVLVSHSGVMAAIHAGFIGQDFGEHNVTVEYPYDCVVRLTLKDNAVASFEIIG